MLKYRLKKIPKKKIIVWSTMLLIFVISLGSIVGFYAAGNPFPGSSVSIIQGDTVTVNDLTADWNYYMGLNYTEVTNKTALPGTSADKTSAESSGKYNISTLVAVQINYNGVDINDASKVGFISSDTNEHQSKLTYYKYIPIVDGKVKIELIDNPYSQRPTGRGFNGWVCDNESDTNSVACEDMTFSYDDDFYLRYLTVNAPVADDNGDKKLVINLKASWAVADLKTSINDIGNFSNKTMKEIPKEPVYELVDVYEKKYEFKSDVDYYERSTVGYNEDLNGCENRPYNHGGKCNDWYCYCYVKVNNELDVDTNREYYLYDYEETNMWGETVDNYRQSVDADFNVTLTDTIIGQENVLVGYKFAFKNDDLLVGYYYKVDNYDNTNKDLYYNANGIRCSVNGANCRDTVYKLIQYSDGDEIKKWSVTTNEEEGTETINTDYTKYYYLVTRDTNILDLPNGTHYIDNLSNKNVPFTVTGAHDGSQDGVILQFNNESSNLNVGEDLVIENVIVNGPDNSHSSETSSEIQNIENQIIAYYQNVKIGRKVINTDGGMTADAVVGGTVGRGTREPGDIAGSIIVESGIYRYIKALSDVDTNSENVRVQMGSDYDRVTGNDTNLSVTYQAVSSIYGNHNSNDVMPTSRMIVKSGKIGKYMLEYTGTRNPADYFKYGIYVGAHAYGNSTSFRTLKVEGGQVFSINGGPCISSSNNGNVIGTYVTGGTVYNIVGGAGVSQTYGNRIVSVTGGTVINSVAGGSNSYVDGNYVGAMYGDTLVYIGGNATIGGTLAYVDDGTNNSLFGVEETGSVFGAGLGRSGSTDRGVVKNSHVIIDQSATIKGSVYGGGNYGATGTQSNEKTYSLVDILGATVKGSVYGASNRNGAGYRSEKRYLAQDYYLLRTINNNRYTDGPDVDKWYTNGTYFREQKQCNNRFYGYSNRRCRYYVRVEAGSEYNRNTRYYKMNSDGNGFTEATPSLNTTFMHTITMNMHDGIIEKSLYGGSNVTGQVLGNVNINLYKGNVVSPNNGVYGGGKGNQTEVAGNITIKTDTSTNSDLLINEIYGGSELGAVNTNGVTNITIDGGNINQVFGGGKGDNSTSPVNGGDITVTMNNGDVENIFGGNNIRGVINTKLEVNVTGGTVNNVYGGSDGSLLVMGTSPTEGLVGATDTNVNISGGKIETAVYGGGKKAVTNGIAIVNIKGGEFITFESDGTIAVGSTPAEVFGGGEAAKVNETYVNILADAQLYNVYGGSNVSGLVSKTNVNSTAGEVLCNTYGGGKIAEVTTANSYIKGTQYSYRLKENETAYINTCGNAFGGGANADVNTANIVLLGSSLLNVYGGSNEGGVVRKTNVLIRDGQTENVFGGNNQGGSTVNSYVDVNNTMVFDLDTNGDGNIDYNIDTNKDGKPDLNIDSNNDGVVDLGVDLDNNGVADSKGTFTVENVFGGSNGLGASIDETTTTNIYGGVVSGDVFGGGNQAKVIKETHVNMYGGTVESLYGGGNRSFVGDAVVNNLGVLVSGNTPGSTYVNVVNGTINKNVYGSSNASFVYGTTSIKIGDYALDALGIDDNKERNIMIDGSVFAGSETNVDKSTTYDDSYEGVTGPAGSGTGLVEISGTSYIKNDVSTLQINGSIYGSGNNSKVVNGSNIHIVNYGTKAHPVTSTSIQRATNVYITDSHIELNGAVDRADPNSYRYSLIRLDKLYMLGSDETKGTYLYLRNGSTFLKALSSGTMTGGTFTPQRVTDNGGNLEVSVADNRIYMLAGKVLSVSDSAAPLYDTTTTKAGPVTGMAFLGMYTREVGKDFVRGIYDYSYGNGDAYDSSRTGSIPSSEYTFVYGLNLIDYTMDEQIKTHGFYTNAVSEAEAEEPLDGKALSFQYIGVTPANESTLYYKWLIGVEPIEIVVDLIADKYSESGAVNALITKEELQEVITNPDGTQTKQEWRDAIMTIQSVNTTGFGATAADATEAFDGILVDKSQIPTINTEDKNGDGVIDANNYFALSMGTTSSGWLDNYKTNFYDEDYELTEESFCDTASGNCTGNQVYLYDSTSRQRNLSFWLYHSKNLDFSYIDKSVDPTNMLIYMNQVKIDVEFRNPHGDPTSTDSTQPVTIVVNISLSDGELDKYGGVIAPGKQYEMFQSRPTTIASNGSFSIYQSLSLDLTKTIAGSSTGEKWDVGKIYHGAKTVEVIDAYGRPITVNWSESYRYLASDYLLPVGTVITMLDLKNNEQYYYEVTTENYTDKQNEFNGKNEYKYYLEDFIRMGSTTGNSKFDDDMKEEDSTKYYYKDENSKLAVEEFIFNVDFAGADVEVANPEGDSHYFFLQLARKEDDGEKVIVSTNGRPSEEMVYILKPLVSSSIATEGGYVQADGSKTNETTIYVGESTQLELETSLIQKDNAGNVLVGVSDTVFDEYKLGAKITVKRPRLDADNNVMHDASGNVIYEDVTNDLFGTIMEINDKIYYPQTDGSTRIELAGRITDVISNINIDFSNSDLTYGKYILVVETFVSYDGLYYGDFEPTYNEFPFELLNNQYGLNVKTETTTQVTHDVNTGEDATGNREIHYIIENVNGLSNPNLKVSLERRDYSSIYGTSYQSIPLTNLVEEIRFGDSDTNIINDSSCHLASASGECYRYNLGNITNSITTKEYDVFLKLKNGPDASDLGTNKPNAKWKSGTYRVVYTLYDGDVEVGSVYEYLVIRSLSVDEIVSEGSGS